MKKRNFVVSLVLLALFAIPMVANAYSTKNGHYFSSSATKGSGYIKSKITTNSNGIDEVYASVRCDGAVQASSGWHFASKELSYNPYYGTWYGYNGAHDSSGYVYVYH